MAQLPVDCLDEIFEYLAEEKFTLHSCLLVNRLWCEVSVRILWREIWNFRTLIACLPNKSKEILYKSGIIIPTPTSKPPLFNYAALCKVLSRDRFYYGIDQLFQQISSQNLNNLDSKIYIVEKEICKLFMKQISSLKKLDICHIWNIPCPNFTSYPGAKDCLKNLSELNCRSDIYPEFFYRLSQICHNIQFLTVESIEFEDDGLADLISVQQNLKHLTIYCCNDLKDIIPTLTNLSNTLIELNLYGGKRHTPLSFINFITKFTNLQEFGFSFDYDYDFDFEDFKKSHYVALSSQLSPLQILKVARPRYELLIKLLEIIGKILKKFYVGEYGNDCDDSLNLTVAKFCQNLRKLSVGFKNNELETLKIIFSSCQYLESIKIWCGGEFLSEKEALEAVVKYSPKNFHELIFYHLYDLHSELLSEELESFFISWTNRIPQKSLSLIIVNNNSNSLDKDNENMKIIEKYINLGIIKKFIVTDFDDDKYNHVPYMF